MKKNSAKKYSIAFGLFTVLALFVSFIVFFFIPTDKQLGQNLFSGSPVLQEITGGKSPADIEATPCPKGIPEEKWHTKYAYRIGGDLNIDEKAYKKSHPEDLILHHKYGIAIYMMERPTEEEIGPLREGLDL